ncbi:MAG: hypothetical protein JWM87_286 [Candidatus Eremiobacteraeota bacterium]|nr:hypothetical protein [Candidatus Eremiobacteraeota bacterium]
MVLRCLWSAVDSACADILTVCTTTMVARRFWAPFPRRRGRPRTAPAGGHATWISRRRSPSKRSLQRSASSSAAVPQSPSARCRRSSSWERVPVTCSSASWNGCATRSNRHATAPRSASLSRRTVSRDARKRSADRAWRAARGTPEDVSVGLATNGLTTLEREVRQQEIRERRDDRREDRRDGPRDQQLHDRLFIEPVRVAAADAGDRAGGHVRR